jgi:predicted nucleic acid-binding protein
VIVVADSTPLRYLILIGHTHVLPALYGRVIIPPAVISELSQERTPEVVRSWLSNTPDWLSVQVPSWPLLSLDSSLGLGEREAIVLAEELTADALLMDDRDARQEAERRNLPVLGTLRVLADAAEHGVADLTTAFERLRETNFRASDQLLQWLLSQAAKRP